MVMAGRTLYSALYVGLSAVALYYMRLGPTSALTGSYLEPLTPQTAPNFTYPGGDVLIRQHYTGIGPLDQLLSMLVTAFLAGPAGFKRHIQVQQANFLASWTSVLVVWSVESVRQGTGWGAMAYTSGWALLYQTVGGAVIVPLYLLIFTLGRQTSSSQTVPIDKARTLVPAVFLGYLVPTALMFYPFANVDHTMLATAFWQPSPILVNILWVVPARFVGKSPSSAQVGAQRHVKAAYALSGGIAAVAHLTTVYLCLSHRYPSVTLRSIFIPAEISTGPFDQAVHFIFQIDYLIIFIATTLWCIQAISTQRQRKGAGGVGLGAVILPTLGALVIGPAATLSAVWYWREVRMAESPRSAKAG